jgi:hypothetical protein
MKAQILSMILRICLHLYLLSHTCIGVYRYVFADKILKNKLTQITDEKIVQFAKASCQKVIAHDINLYTGDARAFGLPQNGYFAAAVGKNNIIIAPDYYTIIETYINDESKERRETVLNIFEFLLHHEASHLKNNDVRNRLLMHVGTYSIKALLLEASILVISSTPISQLVTFTLLNIFDTFVKSIFHMGQEFLADGSAIGQRAIQGGKQFFTNLDNIRKGNQIEHLAMKKDLNHPSPARRLKAMQEAFPTESTAN